MNMTPARTAGRASCRRTVHEKDHQYRDRTASTTSCLCLTIQSYYDSIKGPTHDRLQHINDGGNGGHRSIARGVVTGARGVAESGAIALREIMRSVVRAQAG
jgi:hypothetical protein